MRVQQEGWTPFAIATFMNGCQHDLTVPFWAVGAFRDLGFSAPTPQCWLLFWMWLEEKRNIPFDLAGRTGWDWEGNWDEHNYVNLNPPLHASPHLCPGIDNWTPVGRPPESWGRPAEGDPVEAGPVDDCLSALLIGERRWLAGRDGLFLRHPPPPHMRISWGAGAAGGVSVWRSATPTCSVMRTARSAEDWQIFSAWSLVGK